MDFLPVVGRVPGLDDVWVAGGYSGHGNVLGFACGELVAEAITGTTSRSQPRSTRRVLNATTDAPHLARVTSDPDGDARHVARVVSISPPDDRPA